MSCMQITTCGPRTKVANISPSPGLHVSRFKFSIKLHATSPKFASDVSRHKICNPTCLFGGKEKPENDNEGGSPWKSLEKAMGGFKKEPSMQDVLREQRRRQEMGDFGGGTGSPPGGSSGGGGGSDSGGLSDDEYMAGVWDEVLQVTLATLGFVFMYIYILEGEEFTRLGKDYITYFFTKKTTVRLRRNMYRWKRFYELLTRKRVVRRDWLEREILNTPTWWYDPRQRQLLRGSAGYRQY